MALLFLLVPFITSRELMTLELLWLERYIGASVLNYVFQSKKLGLKHDINEDIYRDASRLTLRGLENFAQTNVAGRKYRYIILGNIEDLDMDRLNALGKVNILTLEQIFGY